MIFHIPRVIGMAVNTAVKREIKKDTANKDVFHLEGHLHFFQELQNLHQKKQAPI